MGELYFIHSQSYSYPSIRQANLKDEICNRSLYAYTDKGSLFDALLLLITAI